MSDRVSMPPDVSAVRAMSGRRVWLEYVDGSAGEVDLDPLLVGTVLAAVRVDGALFAEVFVDEAGTLAWPDGSDLAPEVLYAAALPHLHVPA